MILFYLLISIMPLVRHPIWSDFVGELTMVKHLGVWCLLYALIYLRARLTPLDLFQTWQARWFVLLALMGMASWLIMGAPIPWEISPFMSYASFLMMFFTTLVVVDSLSRLRWVLLVAIGSAGLASLYVLREWQKFPGIRPGWVTGDPNYFTLSALLCLPLAFYLMLEQQRGWERWFCFGCLILTLLAVTLAASRGGFFGLVAASFLVISRSHRRVRSLALVGVMLLALISVSPVSPVDRLLNPNRGDQEAKETRLALWKAGLRIIADHPLVGIGLGNFKPVVAKYSTPGEKLKNIAHNTYIEIAAEMGVPGLLAYLGVLFCSFRTLEEVRRRVVRSGGPPLLLQAALGLQAGLVGYTVAIFFVSAEYQKLYWLTVFLSMCLPSLAAGQLQQDGSART